MNREARLDAIRGEKSWDVIIIGGGATGLGTALDAATRGYRTLLIERGDYSHGTSSRSTKLIHGGVRYLAQGNVRLVREALRERGNLLRNAPHLVHSKDFIVPAYRWWERAYYGLGLTAYDLMSGPHGIGHSRVLGKDRVLDRVPNLKSPGLRGGISYLDGQFDDSRLAISLLRSFEDAGGTALNYVTASAITKRSGKVVGIVARDTETAEEFTIPARAVVNATGVFVDEVRTLDMPESSPLVRPSQGSHLVLDRSFLAGNSALMIPKTDDGRVLFAIPWHGRVLLGTTDTPIDHASYEPRTLADEFDYLLSHIARYLERAPTDSDVLAQFAGLRPLVGDGNGEATSKISREHVVLTSKSGLITVTGGKWTTYRKMAQDTVEQAISVGGLPARACKTLDLRLHGWVPEVPDADDWLAVYGSDLPELESLIAERAEWSRQIHPSLPYRVGEIVWAVRHESARTVEDVLARRLRALFLDARASLEASTLVARVIAEELGRDPAWSDEQERAFRITASSYLVDSRH